MNSFGTYSRSRSCNPIHNNNNNNNNNNNHHAFFVVAVAVVGFQNTNHQNQRRRERPGPDRPRPERAHRTRQEGHFVQEESTPPVALPGVARQRQNGLRALCDGGTAGPGDLHQVRPGRCDQHQGPNDTGKRPAARLRIDRRRGPRHGPGRLRLLEGHPAGQPKGRAFRLPSDAPPGRGLSSGIARRRRCRSRSRSRCRSGSGGSCDQGQHRGSPKDRSRVGSLRRHSQQEDSAGKPQCDTERNIHVDEGMQRYHGRIR
mmetsp:Transcript_29952/g.70595  ORF Transcript_29952/g.70595 Transcript_29952/m.70595 type:complete len:259 (-) Transcript_29952:74-850(-)